MRFHKDIGFPTSYRRPRGRVALRYTRHANEQCERRDVPKLKTITLDRFDVVEIEVEGSRVTKILVRGSLTTDSDIVLALVPGKEYVVKTSWVNDKNDTHKTLDRSIYSRP